MKNVAEIIKTWKNEYAVEIEEIIKYSDAQTDEEVVEYLENDANDAIGEAAEALVDINNYDRLAWLVDNYDLYNEAMREVGHAEGNDIIADIGMAQHYKYSNELNKAVQELIELIEDGE